MNIVEAYIKFKGQLIIFISGLYACGKLKLAKKIQRDFGLTLLNQYDYYKKDYNEKIKIGDNQDTLINWYTDDAIDWLTLNNDIEKYKKDGVIVVGFSLPQSRINKDIHVDYHIHLNIKKQECMEKRKQFLEKHKDKYKEEYGIINTPLEKLIMNKLIFPYYLESVKKSKINKFINVTGLSDDKIYDLAFDSIISFIESYLYRSKDNKENRDGERTPKVSTISKKDGRRTETDSLTLSGELLEEPQYTYDRNLDMITEYSDNDDSDSIKIIPMNEYSDQGIGIDRADDLELPRF
ncbi:MAG: uridine kinase [Barrevirus sp.]|uniref:Uridine kinase n=1 Tax=Barrevirus sp. TaxID=2487763 RepID=A0A3G4ZPU6_9VIRU|nr:MAG: uridine kinase [Barrevirus sp.]